METTRSTAPRVAMVLGGSGGIGAAVSRRLANSGMSVVVHYAGGAGRAQQVVRELRDNGATATAFGGDVADPDDMAALFKHADEEFGGVDVVVNTAGIMTLGPLAQFDLDEFDRMVRVNVRGTFVVTQQAVRHLRDGGSLINFSTSITRLQTPTYAAYAATKGAVEAMTLIAARELRGRNITVNTVAPGPTATPLFLDDKPTDLIERISALSPMERIAQPDDIAAVVADLARPYGWVSGQTVFVNGGAA
ncbi:3-ketoacyl-ACP reductase [Mycobacterium sp. MS1601]|uniref:SDR family oxidoreductase n=1 Tax=Mycobacterium sp. MS1601 TaxID=1936029 RepID=UPI0009791C67|nr:SDR family oxidoreductase [Mycobacterium sp. MS1601]AQA02985.1 3-ketoacyl-ACP reductase [Mycobacterium sp. MS1601]